MSNNVDPDDNAHLIALLVGLFIGASGVMVWIALGAWLFK